MSHSLRSLCVVAIGFAVAAPEAIAQISTQGFQTEARIDGIFARSSGVEAGLGLSIPAGIYVRTGVVGAVGAGTHGVEGRTDLLARFSMDPFRQSHWAPYGGAGISGRYLTEEAGGSRAYLLLFLGIEGPLRYDSRPGWVPAIELGLGGGTRIGFIVRRGIPGRR